MCCVADEKKIFPSCRCYCGRLREQLRTMELEEWEIRGVITVTILLGGKRPIYSTSTKDYQSKKSIFSRSYQCRKQPIGVWNMWGRLSSEIASSCIGGRRHLALPIIFGFPRRMLAADNSARWGMRSKGYVYFLLLILKTRYIYK